MYIETTRINLVIVVSLAAALIVAIVFLDSQAFGDDCDKFIIQTAPGLNVQLQLGKLAELNESLDKQILGEFDAISTRAFAAATACCKMKKITSDNSYDKAFAILTRVEEKTKLLESANAAMAAGRKERSRPLRSLFIQKYKTLRSSDTRSSFVRTISNKQSVDPVTANVNQFLASELADPEQQPSSPIKTESFVEDFNATQPRWKVKWGLRDLVNPQASAVELASDPQEGSSRDKVMRVKYTSRGIRNTTGMTPLQRDVLPSEEVYLAYDVYFPEEGEKAVSDRTSDEKETYHSIGSLPSLTTGVLFHEEDMIKAGLSWPRGPVWQSDRSEYVFKGLEGQKASLPGDDRHFVLAKGRWHSIEYRYRLNEPGQSNGTFEAWVNGIRVISNNKVKYREDKAIVIDRMSFDTTYDPASESQAADEKHLYFDNFVVSSYPITH